MNNTGIVSEFKGCPVEKIGYGEFIMMFLMSPQTFVFPKYAKNLVLLKNLKGEPDVGITFGFFGYIRYLIFRVLRRKYIRKHSNISEKI